MCDWPVYDPFPGTTRLCARSGGPPDDYHLSLCHQHRDYFLNEVMHLLSGPAINADLVTRLAEALMRQADGEDEHARDQARRGIGCLVTTYINELASAEEDARWHRRGHLLWIDDEILAAVDRLVELRLAEKWSAA